MKRGSCFLRVGLADGEVLTQRVRSQFTWGSVGWTVCGESTLDQCLARADDTMYFEKEARKAKVRV